MNARSAQVTGVDLMRIPIDQRFSSESWEMNGHESIMC